MTMTEAVQQEMSEFLAGAVPEASIDSISKMSSQLAQKAAAIAFMHAVELLPEPQRQDCLDGRVDNVLEVIESHGIDLINILRSATLDVQTEYWNHYKATGFAGSWDEFLENARTMSVSERIVAFGTRLTVHRPVESDEDAIEAIMLNIAECQPSFEDVSVALDHALRPKMPLQTADAIVQTCCYLLTAAGQADLLVDTHFKVGAAFIKRDAADALDGAVQHFLSIPPLLAQTDPRGYLAVASAIFALLAKVQKGCSPHDDLLFAESLVATAREIVPSNELAGCLSLEGDVHRAFADAGMDLAAHLQTAIIRYAEARSIATEGDPILRQTWVREALSCTELAMAEVDPVQNLRRAISCWQGYLVDPDGAQQATMGRRCVAEAAEMLARHQDDPEQTLQLALRYALESMEGVPEGQAERALAMALQASILMAQVEAGISEIDIVHEAVRLFRSAGSCAELGKTERDVFRDRGIEAGLYLLDNEAQVPFGFPEFFSLVDEALLDAEPGSEAHLDLLTSKAHGYVSLADKKNASTDAIVSCARDLDEMCADLPREDSLHPGLRVMQALLLALVAQQGTDYRTNAVSALAALGSISSIPSELRSEAELAEAIARTALALDAFHANRELSTVLDLTQRVCQREEAGTNLWRLATHLQASAHLALSELGPDRRDHLESATSLSLADGGRANDSSDDDLGILISVRDITTHLQRAMVNEDPLAELRPALSLASTLRRKITPDHPAYAGVLLSEVQCLVFLANLGQEPLSNLRAAVDLCGMGRRSLPSEGPTFTALLVFEARTRAALGFSGDDTFGSLAVAGELCQEARRKTPPTTTLYGIATATEAGVRSLLGLLDIDPINSFRNAALLFQMARSRLSEGGLLFASSVMGEASARLQLALGGYATDENMQAAESLSGEAVQRLDRGSVDWIRAVSNFAVALFARDAVQESYELLKHGLEAMETIRAHMARAEERTGFLEALSYIYGLMVTVCLDRAERSPLDEAETWLWEAWHWVQSGKSRSLLETMAEVRPRLGSKEETLWQELESKAQILDSRERQFRAITQILDWPGAGGEPEAVPDRQIQELRHSLLEARRAYDSLYKSVAARLSGEGALIVRRVPPAQEVLAEVRNLAAQEPTEGRRPVFIEFFVANDTEIVVFVAPLWKEASPTIRRITLEEGALRRMVEDTFESTGQAVGAKRAASQKSHNELDPDARAAARARFEELLALLSALVEPWAGLADEWQATEIVLSPHYVLNLLPLHAALWQGIPLILRWPIVYLPSATLASDISRTSDSKHSIHEAVLVGNPLSGDPGIDRALHLEGAAQEIQQVDRYLTGAGVTSLLLSGHEATTSRVMAQAPVASVLHFACHSKLEPDDFSRSGIELADRRLTVTDITAKMRLERASLVYLSSCDSGLPLPGRTDELMALARAFLYAGAPSIIASLWACDDAAARNFADIFYRAWLRDGQSMAVAFQTAAREMHEHLLHHPMEWAPFILMGAWQATRSTLQ